LVDNCESWKKKLEEELKTEKLKATKLEPKKKLLVKSVNDLESQLFDLQSINFAYIEENKSYEAVIGNYKSFLNEIELKVRKYYQEFERSDYKKKESLSDELRKIERRNSFPFFSSPPSTPSPKDDYIRDRTKYRKLSEVSEIDYLNEEIVQIEDKILRLITNIVEKEYHLNLSLFTGLRKKIKTKEARIKELEDVINANAVVDCDEIDETEKQEVKIERADSISKTLPTSITKIGENYQNLSDILEKNESEEEWKPQQEIVREILWLLRIIRKDIGLEETAPQGLREAQEFLKEHFKREFFKLH